MILILIRVVVDDTTFELDIFCLILELLDCTESYMRTETC